MLPGVPERRKLDQDDFTNATGSDVAINYFLSRIDVL
jgi:hypothetical protein